MHNLDLESSLRACPDSDSLQSTLRRNLGRVCTIHVPGEPAPLGVTGVLSEVGLRTCKLISLDGASRSTDCDGARRIHTIPLDKITYVDTAQY